MRYPKILFVYCNENDDYSWDCNRQETWTGEVRYILQSEYDKLKAENERLKEALREIAEDCKNKFSCDVSNKMKVYDIAQQALKEETK